MAKCHAELCEHWTGHGCICAVLDIEIPEVCKICRLPDRYDGDGDGFDSCMCRCECDDEGRPTDG